MNPTEWAAVVGCVIAIMSAVYSAMRIMIKAVMQELLPNSGKSLRDQVDRIEKRLDSLMDKLLEDTP
jgi:DNA-binding FrmR family transcriptional regulator